MDTGTATLVVTAVAAIAAVPAAVYARKAYHLQRREIDANDRRSLEFTSVQFSPENPAELVSVITVMVLAHVGSLYRGVTLRATLEDGRVAGRSAPIDLTENTHQGIEIPVTVELGRGGVVILSLHEHGGRELKSRRERVV